MTENHKKIGVFDSGVGGLTVVKELENLLPKEDIVYFGDNKNCPYGNRTAENIVEIARSTIAFLQAQEVKAVVIACNTTSSLLGRFGADYALPIFGIIQPAADCVLRGGFAAVGVIATELTIKTGGYEKSIHAGNPNIAVYGEPSRFLAKLVDCGEFDLPAITAEVNEHVEHLLAAHPLKNIVLGCTHYPIVGEIFEQAAPQVNFINPAREQACAVARYLAAHALLNDQAGRSLTIYTSGVPEVYQKILARLEISTPAVFHEA